MNIFSIKILEISAHPMKVYATATLLLQKVHEGIVKRIQMNWAV